MLQQKVHISTNIYTTKEYQKTQCYGAMSHTKVLQTSAIPMVTTELVHLMGRVDVLSAQATCSRTGGLGKRALSRVQ